MNADISMNVGADASTQAIEELGNQIARENCILVDHYPPVQTQRMTDWGCQLFSGVARIGSGGPQKLFWTRCQQGSE